MRFHTITSVLLILSIGRTWQTCNRYAEPFFRAFNACNNEMSQLHKNHFYETFLSNPNKEDLSLICKVYERWVTCFQSLANTCGMEPERVVTGFEEALEVTYLCGHHLERTASNLECMSTQSPDKNPAYKGCHTLRAMREKSIQKSCRFQQEQLACEDRLMRSACGSIMADFVNAIKIRRRERQWDMTDQCDIQNTQRLSGFSYSRHCPPDFPVQMGYCHDKLAKIRIPFNSDMLAVAKASSAAVNNWCREFKSYTQCMLPIRGTCPAGVDLVYDTETEWYREYRVADYICNDVFTTYKRHLECYQNVRGSIAYARCWKKFPAFPSKWDAYRMKCNPLSEENRRHQSELQRLLDCFSAMVYRDCGEEAAKAITPLMSMQYSFQFLPPCGGETEQVIRCAPVISSSVPSQVHFLEYAYSKLTIVYFSYSVLR